MENSAAADERQRAGDVSALGAVELAGMIDHTVLKPEATPADIRRLCAEALEYGFFSVCVNPVHVPLAVDLLAKTPVTVCCVAGFPLGANQPETKAIEARQALAEGAQEIDMVIQVGALKAGDDTLVRRDIEGVVAACHAQAALCKVILETCLLTEAEKVRACELCLAAGADFVKTSTGFSRGGATVADIALMARTVAPGKLGVKASGGVRTYADARRLVAAGATRIGSSNSVAMVQEAQAAGSAA